jgi:hypothetical protein
LRLRASVNYTALVLLHRLKMRFPAARGSSRRHHFLSAFMIASKVVCDDTYSNKSRAVISRDLFALCEANQMEREMCAYLEWQLQADTYRHEETAKICARFVRRTQRTRAQGGTSERASA